MFGWGTGPKFGGCVTAGAFLKVLCTMSTGSGLRGKLAFPDAILFFCFFLQKWEGLLGGSVESDER